MRTEEEIRIMLGRLYISYEDAKKTYEIKNNLFWRMVFEKDLACMRILYYVLGEMDIE